MSKRKISASDKQFIEELIKIISGDKHERYHVLGVTKTLNSLYHLESTIVELVSEILLLDEEAEKEAQKIEKIREKQRLARIAKETRDAEKSKGPITLSPEGARLRHFVEANLIKKNYDDEDLDDLKCGLRKGGAGGGSNNAGPIQVGTTYY